MAIYQRLSGY